MVRVMNDRITPKDRQEVAAKLREAGRELDGDSTSSIRSAFCEIDHIIGTQDTGRTFEPFFDRLADLIDYPTCHDFGGEEGTNGEGYDFACSACGYCCDLPNPDHCPHCGARVVSEDV